VLKRLLALLLIFLAASGCRAPSSARPPLEFWTLSLKPTYTDFMEGLRLEFERENPGMRAEWLDLPERILFLKLLASLAAGAPPDLVNIATAEASRLAENHALVPTDGLVTEAERSRYFPQFWSAVERDGKRFCIPWYVSIRLMMFNKTLFAEAGLDPSRPPRTWDEIEQAARAFRKIDAYGFLPVIRIMDDWQMDGLPILDRSGRHAAFVTPAHAARLEWYARLYRDGVIPPETLTGGYPDAVRRYKEGRLGMLMTGPQFLLSIRQDAPDVYAVTGVAPLPRGKAGIVPASVMHFVIPMGTKDARGAARLGLFLTSPTNQLALCKLVPLLPSTIETTRDPYFTRGSGKHPLDDAAIRIDAEQLPYARDLNPALPNQDVLNRILNDAVERAVYGRVSALAGLREAAAEWDRILATQAP
jgi:putative chitobiose transport system substrate-binding protein